MIRPLLRALIAVSACLQSSAIAKKLTSNSRRICSWRVSMIVAPSPIPALLISTSSGPTSASIRAITPNTSTGFERSTTTAVAHPPPSRIDRATECSSSAFSARMTTMAPSRANSRAAASPIPDEAPVISTRLSCNRVDILCCRNLFTRMLLTEDSCLGVMCEA